MQIYENRKLWGWITLVSTLLACLGIVLMSRLVYSGRYFFVDDSNKIFAIIVAVSSFLWFKNISIPQSKIINAIGGSTFGVLLIHANSNAMRIWLWNDTIDVAGHFELPLIQLIGFSIAVVFTVFVICNLIDQIRVQLLEKPFFKWYDKILDNKLKTLIRTN